jgi:hypothetical protein
MNEKKRSKLKTENLDNLLTLHYHYKCKEELQPCILDDTNCIEGSIANDTRAFIRLQLDNELQDLEFEAPLTPEEKQEEGVPAEILTLAEQIESINLN